MQIAIGTPQRLLDLLGGRGARARLKRLKAVVLDEVDALLPPADAATPTIGRYSGKVLTVERGRGGARGGGARGGGRAARGGRGRGGGRGPVPYDGADRRKAQKKPAVLLIERLAGNMKAGARLQLVACSATVDAPMRRQHAPRAAGVAPAAGPPHARAAARPRPGGLAASPGAPQASEDHAALREPPRLCRPHQPPSPPATLPPSPSPPLRTAAHPRPSCAHLGSTPATSAIPLLSGSARRWEVLGRRRRGW